MGKLTATGRFSIAHVWLTEDKSKKHREETISTKKRSLSTNWIYHILYSIDDFSGPVVYGIFDKHLASLGSDYPSRTTFCWRVHHCRTVATNPEKAWFMMLFVPSHFNNPQKLGSALDLFLAWYLILRDFPACHVWWHQRLSTLVYIPLYHHHTPMISHPSHPMFFPI